MTLHEAVRYFRWDELHDYGAAIRHSGAIVATHALGLYEADLERLKEMVPGLTVTERRRVEHDHGAWLRVDVVEPK